MTRAQMMAIATAFAETSGRAYVTTAAEQNAVANRRMVRFAQMAKCFYSDAIAFTLTPGTAVYDLRGVALAKKVAEVQFVTVNGSPLFDFSGKPGLVSVDELIRNQPTYLGSSSAAPQVATMLPPQSIRLWPAPDQAYSHSYVSGYYLPADIDTTSGGDSTALEFPDDDAEMIGAFVGIGLVEWGAASESDYERLAVFDKRLAARFQELTSRTQAMVSGPSIRGERSSTRTVRLG